MKFIIAILFVLALLLLGIPDNVVLAQDAPSYMEQLQAGGTGAGIENTETPIDPRSFIAYIIQIALSFVGIIFTGLTVYGGYLRVTAHGENERIEKSTKVITAAVIGLAITLLALGITVAVSTIVGTAANPAFTY